MKTTDELITNILESYKEYGGVNLSETNTFPNTETVISIVKDLQSLIFPGFRTAEYLNTCSLKYITGERIQRIIALLTLETQKALVYLRSSAAGSHCFGLEKNTVLSLIEEIPEIRRKIHTK